MCHSCILCWSDSSQASIAPYHMTSDKVLQWSNVLSIYCKKPKQNHKNSLIYGTTGLAVVVVVVVAAAAAAAAARCCRPLLWLLLLHHRYSWLLIGWKHTFTTWTLDNKQNSLYYKTNTSINKLKVFVLFNEIPINTMFHRTSQIGCCMCVSWFSRSLLGILVSPCLCWTEASIVSTCVKKC